MSELLSFSLRDNPDSLWPLVSGISFFWSRPPARPSAGHKVHSRGRTDPPNPNPNPRYSNSSFPTRRRQSAVFPTIVSELDVRICTTSTYKTRIKICIGKTRTGSVGFHAKPQTTTTAAAAAQPSLDCLCESASLFCPLS